MEEDYEYKCKKSLEQNYKFCFWSFVATLQLILLAVLFSGCTTTKYVEVPVEHIVYMTKTDTILKADSVYLHDSVYVHSKGDTVLIEKWHTQYRDRIEYKVKTDSFIKVDSVAVPYPVERKLSKWEQIKIDIGGYLIIGLLIVIIFSFLIALLRRKGNRGV